MEIPATPAHEYRARNEYIACSYRPPRGELFAFFRALDQFVFKKPMTFRPDAELEFSQLLNVFWDGLFDPIYRPNPDQQRNPDPGRVLMEHIFILTHNQLRALTGEDVPLTQNQALLSELGFPFLLDESQSTRLHDSQRVIARQNTLCNTLIFCGWNAQELTAMETLGYTDTDSLPRWAACVGITDTQVFELTGIDVSASETFVATARSLEQATSQHGSIDKQRFVTEALFPQDAHLRLGIPIDSQFVHKVVVYQALKTHKVLSDQKARLLHRTTSKDTLDQEDSDEDEQKEKASEKKPQQPDTSEIDKGIRAATSCLKTHETELITWLNAGFFALNPPAVTTTSHIDNVIAAAIEQLGCPVEQKSDDRLDFEQYIAFLTSEQCSLAMLVTILKEWDAQRDLTKKDWLLSTLVVGLTESEYQPFFDALKVNAPIKPRLRLSLKSIAFLTPTNRLKYLELCCQNLIKLFEQQVLTTRRWCATINMVIPKMSDHDQTGELILLPRLDTEKLPPHAFLRTLELSAELIGLCVGYPSVCALTAEQWITALADTNAQEDLKRKADSAFKDEAQKTLLETLGLALNESQQAHFFQQESFVQLLLHQFYMLTSERQARLMIWITDHFIEQSASSNLLPNSWAAFTPEDTCFIAFGETSFDRAAITPRILDFSMESDRKGSSSKRTSTSGGTEHRASVPIKLDFGTSLFAPSSLLKKLLEIAIAPTPPTPSKALSSPGSTSPPFSPKTRYPQSPARKSTRKEQQSIDLQTLRALLKNPEARLALVTFGRVALTDQWLRKGGDVVIQRFLTVRRKNLKDCIWPNQITPIDTTFSDTGIGICQVELTALRTHFKLPGPTDESTLYELMDMTAKTIVLTPLQAHLLHEGKFIELAPWQFPAQQRDVMFDIYSKLQSRHLLAVKTLKTIPFNDVAHILGRRNPRQFYINEFTDAQKERISEQQGCIRIDANLLQLTDGSIPIVHAAVHLEKTNKISLLDQMETLIANILHLPKYWRLHVFLALVFLAWILVFELWWLPATTDLLDAWLDSTVGEENRKDYNYHNPMQVLVSMEFIKVFLLITRYFCKMLACPPCISKKQQRAQNSGKSSRRQSLTINHADMTEQLITQHEMSEESGYVNPTQPETPVKRYPFLEACKRFVDEDKRQLANQEKFFLMAERLIGCLALLCFFSLAWQFLWKLSSDQYFGSASTTFVVVNCIFIPVFLPISIYHGSIWVSTIWRWGVAGAWFLFAPFVYWYRAVSSPCMRPRFVPIENKKNPPSLGLRWSVNIGVELLLLAGFSWRMIFYLNAVSYYRRTFTQADRLPDNIHETLFDILEVYSPIWTQFAFWFLYIVILAMIMIDLAFIIVMIGIGGVGTLDLIYRYLVLQKDFIRKGHRSFQIRVIKAKTVREHYFEKLSNNPWLTWLFMGWRWMMDASSADFWMRCKRLYFGEPEAPPLPIAPIDNAFYRTLAGLIRKQYPNFPQNEYSEAEPRRLGASDV